MIKRLRFFSFLLPGCVLSVSLHHRFSLSLLQQQAKQGRAEKMLRGLDPFKKKTTPQPYPLLFYSPPVSLPGAHPPHSYPHFTNCKVSGRTATRSASTRELCRGVLCYSGGHFRSWCSRFMHVPAARLFMRYLAFLLISSGFMPLTHQSTFNWMPMA
jgi:hypothetical protein